MKHILPLGVVGLFAAVASAGVPSLDESFDDFDLPSGFTVINYDGLGVNTAHFAPSLPPQQTWYNCDLGLTRHKGVLDDFSPLTGRTSLLSVSHRDNAAVATDNWLITPKTEITEGDILSWEAKSVHYILRENYSVLISTTGTAKEDFTEICAVENESYVWKRHSVDLSAYAGQSVYIAFAHTSTHKFLLALDYVKVAAPEAVELVARNTGRHYFDAEEDGVLSFSLVNHGAAGRISSFVVRRSDTETTVGTFDASEMELEPLGEYGIDVPVDLALDDPYPYTLVAVGADGSETTLLSDFANRSTYRRRMLIEKFTGVWCNSCPHVIYPYHISSLQLGEEAIPIEIHSAGPGATDKDALSFYSSPTVYPVNGDYPSLWYNRSVQQVTYKPQDRSFFDKAVLAPTVASIDMALEPSEGNNVTVKAKMKFAEDIDNSDDHITLQFTLVEHNAPSHIASSEQQWASPGSLLCYGEFYYMPTSVPKDINPLENVTRSTTAHMKGNGGLPAELVAGEEYEVAVTLSVPEEMLAEDDLFVVGSVIDASTRTYEVMNANTVDAPAELIAMEPEPETPDVPEDPSGVDSTLNDNITVVRTGGKLRIAGCADGFVSIYDACGVLCCSGRLSDGEGLFDVPECGIVIVNVTTPSGVMTRKLR